MAHGVETYTPVDTALARTLSSVRVRREAEAVDPRLAYGRVSAKDVLAPRDVPDYPTAHWDGYAVISEDLAGAGEENPVRLRVRGAAGPGSRPAASIESGEAYQVATGAGLPSGADTVVAKESVVAHEGEIVVKEPSPLGDHVYAVGEDLKKGETILAKGQVIRAQDAGALIGSGFLKVKVWKRPRVSVVATGSELVELGTPKKGKVVNSHSPVFLRLCEALGCTPVDLGIAKDDRGVLSKQLRQALARSDLVLTLGGTSAGERDYVTDAIEGLRPEVLVHGVKMDRGRVAGVAVVSGKPIVMMPGPIQGAMNAFLLLSVPLIEVLSGTEGRRSEILCTFRGEWQARRRYSDFRKVVYVRLERGTEVTASPLLAETESMKILTSADGCVVVPENVTRIGAGEKVAVRLVPGFSFA
ncbi:MAG TPA: molybdopterin molybdotransferase MoeA [Nitrososphaerales archaeon]|nr:molybdopterin molybdotransferase MoeA [Nitrososphaerales archaeon]